MSTPEAAELTFDWAHKRWEDPLTGTEVVLPDQATEGPRVEIGAPASAKAIDTADANPQQYPQQSRHETKQTVHAF